MRKKQLHQYIVVIILVALISISCKENQKKDMTQITDEKVVNNKFAVCELSIVPLRADGDHRSDFVTQVLFGEYMKVLKIKEDWSYVELQQDGYKGWMETLQYHEVSKEEYDKFSKSEKFKTADTYSKLLVEGNEIIVAKGTNLPFYDGNSFTFSGEKIPFSGNVVSGKHDRVVLLETAHTYINTPYLWGGKSHNGIDCSGFSQMVYHLNGYDIQRDASQQAKEGELVAFLTEAKPGDLAFFDNEEGRITHVGIILEEGKIIHAAKGKVRIDKIDQEGIYNDELKEYTHHLRMVRTYF